MVEPVFEDGLLSLFAVGGMFLRKCSRHVSHNYRGPAPKVISKSAGQKVRVKKCGTPRSIFRAIIQAPCIRPRRCRCPRSGGCPSAESACQLPRSWHTIKTYEYRNPMKCRDCMQTSIGFRLLSRRAKSRSRLRHERTGPDFRAVAGAVPPALLA